MEEGPHPLRDVAPLIVCGAGMGDRTLGTPKQTALVVGDRIDGFDHLRNRQVAWLGPEPEAPTRPASGPQNTSLGELMQNLGQIVSGYG